MYKRILQQKLVELSGRWSVISVTGPRQSGKTTLCKMTFPDYGYVNLERAMWPHTYSVMSAKYLI